MRLLSAMGTSTVREVSRITGKPKSEAQERDCALRWMRYRFYLFRVKLHP